MACTSAACVLPAARGISRSVSQQHRSAPALQYHHGDPDQHVFIGYRAHGLTDGRKRAPPLCANPRCTTGCVTRRSERGPATRPSFYHERPFPLLHRPSIAFPRALTYVVIVVARSVDRSRRRYPQVPTATSSKHLFSV